jgi:hypothetical protein
MKTLKRIFTVMAIVAIFGFAACGGGDEAPYIPTLSNLSGSINISPTTATVGTELSATYSGSEAVNYQWNKDGTAINGKTTTKLTPNEGGSYTVTVSASGYNGKTSAAVNVTVKLCECPAGTIHLVGEANTCNSENNCNCEHDVPGTRVHGIAVTNREGVDNFGDLNTEETMVYRVNLAVTYFTGEKLAFIKANIKEIKIVTGNWENPTISGNILTVGNDRSENSIWGALNTYTSHL